MLGVGGGQHEAWTDFLRKGLSTGHALTLALGGEQAGVTHSSGSSSGVCQERSQGKAWGHEWSPEGGPHSTDRPGEAGMGMRAGRRGQGTGGRAGKGHQSRDHLVQRWGS